MLSAALLSSHVSPSIACKWMNSVRMLPARGSSGVGAACVRGVIALLRTSLAMVLCTRSMLSCQSWLAKVTCARTRYDDLCTNPAESQFVAG